MHSVKKQDDWKHRLKDKGKPLSSSLRAELLQTAEGLRPQWTKQSSTAPVALYTK